MPALKEEINLLSASYQIRADKLALFAEQLGSDAKLAGILGFSPVRLHRLIRKRDVPFTEKLARAIEARINKPYGWLDESSEIAHPLDQFAIPIYFLEDLTELAQNKAKIAGHYPFITPIHDAYFVQITSSSYAPWIAAGSLLLINPHEKTLQNSQIYIISYEQNKQLLRAVIRKVEHHKLVNPATLEQDELKHWIVHGKCELIITPTIS